MKAAPPHRIEEEDSNRSGNPAFEDVARMALSRRSILGGGAATAAGLFVGAGSVGCSSGAEAPWEGEAAGALAPAAGAIPGAPVTSLGFDAVPKSLEDTVAVPPGYTATVLCRTGDPILPGAKDYANDGTADDFELRAGDHHDGVEFFPLNAAGTRRDPRGTSRGILAMNHENVTAWALHAEGGTSPSAGPRPKAEVDREMAAHGISVVEVQKRFGAFQVNRRSKFNRRITTATPFDLRGPVRGHALAVTKYSPGGTATRGTVNNCGTGITPWGTLLSGEENWASYAFRAAGDDAARGGSTAKSVVALKRYGNEEGPSRFAKRWDSAGDEDSYARWNGSVLGDDAATDYRNVLNTYGYMVEVDPYDPTSTPVKRTALGRFAHEGATFAPARAGQPLVAYMGDDSRGEYIYKFVSKAPWSERDREPRSRMSVGHKYLDEGTLYAAKFNEDGTGEWVELSLNNPAVRNFSGYAFEDEADVLVHARIAADAAGATRMDRPEWCSVNPKNGEVYFTLTNNSRRTPEATDSANPRSYDDTFGTGESARTQTGNVHGHIIRMAERKGDSAARAFAWDVYLFGAEATSDPERVNLSGLTDDNDFSSPDGLWFSHATGICWIQTDDGAYTDVTNCMLLAALPGKVGDGRPTTLTYGSEGASSRTVTTPAGAVATAATVRRFLVGPVECEITGITETPDGRALFVNIQHPGEDTNPAYARNPLKYTSHWPDGGYARPRSATIVITKDDGGVIGS